MDSHLFTRQAQYFQTLRIEDPSILTVKSKVARITPYQPKDLARLTIPASTENNEETVTRFALLAKRATQEDKNNWVKNYRDARSNKMPLKQRYWFKHDSLFLRQKFWMAVVEDDVFMALEAFLTPLETHDHDI